MCTSSQPAPALFATSADEAPSTKEAAKQFPLGDWEAGFLLRLLYEDRARYFAELGDYYFEPARFYRERFIARDAREPRFEIPPHCVSVIQRT